MTTTVTTPGLDLWLPLLQRLTNAVPQWYVWKNAESAFSGPGDIDSAAPPEAWPAIEQAFRAWAQEKELDRVIACRHIPRTLNLIATSDRLPHLLQLEVKELTTMRGSPFFHAADLLPLTTIDPHGFRRLRPGAEGLLKFIMNGVQRGGAPDWPAMERKGVMDLIERDPEGVMLTGHALGRPGSHLLEAVRAARKGGWDQRSLRRVETAAMLNIAAHPLIFVERVWFRVARKPFCPLLKVIYRTRRSAPADLDAWLADVSRSHTVWTPPRVRAARP